MCRGFCNLPHEVCHNGCHLGVLSHELFHLCRYLGIFFGDTLHPFDHPNIGVVQQLFHFQLSEPWNEDGDTIPCPEIGHTD